VLPTGTVTFLFTDIEASTSRWENDEVAMGAELAAHDEVWRSAVAGHGGFVFKHTGDGVCAAFGLAHDAVAAAVESQRRLRLPVRVGIATGSAELRDGDYFGRPLNRAARVMAAGHGGQILVAATTAALLEGVDLADLGEHRMAGLSGLLRVFQVCAEGLQTRFPPLRTEAVPGNLPAELTRFVGRAGEVRELAGVVGANRLVTLTGVGGIGKTRLALQVARRLVAEFPDGVWLVELAPLGDPVALPDVVATALGITARPGFTVLDGVVQAVAGRRMLVVLDNCEHVLDAAADLTARVLAHTRTVSVLATSREGLGLPGEHLWPVTSLDIDRKDGGSAAELFVERAQALRPAFSLADEADLAAVVEICGRLDGIPLAIELAAARMVSMNPRELLPRLSDRFRLLAGARRSPGRHQTLRHAVTWSYEMLTVEEREVLGRCAVFAGGFDLAAVAHLDGSANAYDLLDILDSLVRKSLMNTAQVGGRTRYGLYETIRLFTEEQIDPATLAADRERHAHYFAEEVEPWWTRWDSPDQRLALDWVAAEFANLRGAFYWTADGGDLVTATRIAAHTVMFCQSLQLYEPVGWAEGLLAAATTADVAQLPRLYTAAAFCAHIGRPDTGVEYARRAAELDRNPKYDPFEPSWADLLELVAHILAGHMDVAVAIGRELASRTGLERVAGLATQAMFLPVLGRNEEARLVADEAVAAARQHGNPFWIALALYGYGRAFTEFDADRALQAFREALECAHRNHIAFHGVVVAPDLAHLEVDHGELDDGLVLFDEALDAAHRAGSHTQLGVVLAHLACVFRELGRDETAATVYGSSTPYPSIATVASLPGVVGQLRLGLGHTTFDHCVGSGAAMEASDAVRYARQQIQAARHGDETT
jgi:predicted ATPase